LTGGVAIFVDMEDTQASTRTSSRTTNRTPSRPIPVPQSRPESNELRDLLETYLSAMEALLDEHQRTLDRTLRSADGVRAELVAELRALGDHRAPWVKAIAETRALLYVALREVIVGDDDAGVSRHLPAMH
jgi:hypothetical protein